MEFVVENHSSYPRVGDRPGQQRLRRAAAARERGEIDAAEFAAAERAQIDEIIHEQEQAGVDVVTDGQIRWADPISHVMGALDGVRIDGLLRFFDTNCYFRQPVVTGAVGRRAPILRDDYRLACYVTARCVKPVLLGPYTLARLSVIESGPYRSVGGLAQALSAVLCAEVAELAEAGARVIQIDEPAILSHPSDIGLLHELLEPLWAARGGAQVILATYFGDAAPLYAQLHSVPADIVAFDFTYAPRLAEVVAATGAGKLLGLGVIDGRNTRLESAAALAHQVDTLLPRYRHGRIHLLPSCGLEYVPRAVALAKLELLAHVRAMVKGA